MSRKAAVSLQQPDNNDNNNDNNNSNNNNQCLIQGGPRGGKLGFPPKSLRLIEKSIVRQISKKNFLGEECPQSRALLMYKEFPPQAKNPI